jgi:hypothetical protein
MNTTDYTKETLRGLEGVAVIVETLNPDAEADSLSVEDIQTDVEDKLSSAGVRILSMAQWRAAAGKPWLYVSVNTMKYLLTYFFSIDVHLKQDVTLSRRPSIITSCSTWEVGSVGFVDAAGLAAKIRRSVTQYVDQFIDDFKAVNDI